MVRSSQANLLLNSPKPGTALQYNPGVSHPSDRPRASPSYPPNAPALARLRRAKRLRYPCPTRRPWPSLVARGETLEQRAPVVKARSLALPLLASLWPSSRSSSLLHTLWLRHTPLMQTLVPFYIFVHLCSLKRLGPLLRRRPRTTTRVRNTLILPIGNFSLYSLQTF